MLHSRFVDRQLVFFQPGVIESQGLNGTAVAFRGAIDRHEAIMRLAGFPFALKSYSHHERAIVSIFAGPETPGRDPARQRRRYQRRATSPPPQPRVWRFGD